MKLSPAILIAAFLIMSLSCNLFAAGYAGFTKLNEKDCVVLDDDHVHKLPSTWHKYKGFIKSCGLQKKAEKAKVFIISVWGHEYLDANNLDMWEEFPLPVIVDDQWNQVGSFPELYPSELECDLKVYYGNWKMGIPKEIRIDVSNPTVSGDYYYAPLRWNPNSMMYIMKDTEEKYGKRPR